MKGARDRTNFRDLSYECQRSTFVQRILVSLLRFHVNATYNIGHNSEPELYEYARIGTGFRAKNCLFYALF